VQIEKKEEGERERRKRRERRGAKRKEREGRGLEFGARLQQAFASISDVVIDLDAVKA